MIVKPLRILYHAARHAAMKQGLFSRHVEHARPHPGGKQDGVRRILAAAFRPDVKASAARRETCRAVQPVLEKVRVQKLVPKARDEFTALDDLEPHVVFHVDALDRLPADAVGDYQRREPQTRRRRPP